MDERGKGMGVERLTWTRGSLPRSNSTRRPCHGCFERIRPVSLSDVGKWWRRLTTGDGRMTERRRSIDGSCRDIIEPRTARVFRPLGPELPYRIHTLSTRIAKVFRPFLCIESQVWRTGVQG